MPSSPVPRTKLLVAVRLLPAEVPSATLLRLMPSAQIVVRRLLRTVPPVPDAQNPDNVCWVQIPSAIQFDPVVSIVPPAPSADARLVAFESAWKFCTVHEVTLKRAGSGVPFGSGTSR